MNCIPMLKWIWPFPCRRREERRERGHIKTFKIIQTLPVTCSLQSLKLITAASKRPIKRRIPCNCYQPGYNILILGSRGQICADLGLRSMLWYSQCYVLHYVCRSPVVRGDPSRCQSSPGPSPHTNICSLNVSFLWHHCRNLFTIKSTNLISIFCVKSMCSI